MINWLTNIMNMRFEDLTTGGALLVVPLMLIIVLVIFLGGVFLFDKYIMKD